jgi:hypothetical protein
MASIRRYTSPTCSQGSSTCGRLRASTISCPGNGSRPPFNARREAAESQEVLREKIKPFQQGCYRSAFSSSTICNLSHGLTQKPRSAGGAEGKEAPLQRPPYGRWWAILGYPGQPGRIPRDTLDGVWGLNTIRRAEVAEEGTSLTAAKELALRGRPPAWCVSMRTVAAPVSAFVSD